MPPSEYKRLEELMQQQAAMLLKHAEVSERRHVETLKELSNTNTSVRNLSLAVIGDEKLGVDGMVKRVYSLEQGIEVIDDATKELPERVVKLEESEKKRVKRGLIMFGVGLAGSTAGGFSLSKLLQMLGDAFTKH